MVRDEDLDGAVVNLAARICGRAEPGQTLVSAAVKELAVGKSLGFIDRGPIALKGFDDPARLDQVDTTEAEVIEKLGEPTFRNKNPDGGVILVDRDAKLKFTSSTGRRTSVSTTRCAACRPVVLGCD